MRCSAERRHIVCLIFPPPFGWNGAGDHHVLLQIFDFEVVNFQDLHFWHKTMVREFPGSPVVRTRQFSLLWPQLDP